MFPWTFTWKTESGIRAVGRGGTFGSENNGLVNCKKKQWKLAFYIAGFNRTAAHLIAINLTEAQAGESGEHLKIFRLGKFSFRQTEGRKNPGKPPRKIAASQCFPFLSKEWPHFSPLIFSSDVNFSEREEEACVQPERERSAREAVYSGECGINRNN